jgi:hypothetical protein
MSLKFSHSRIYERGLLPSQPPHAVERSDYFDTRNLRNDDDIVAVTLVTSRSYPSTTRLIHIALIKRAAIEEIGCHCFIRRDLR